MTLAGTSNELDVQSEWEENTKHTLFSHTHCWYEVAILIVGGVDDVGLRDAEVDRSYTITCNLLGELDPAGYLILYKTLRTEVPFIYAKGQRGTLHWIPYVSQPVTIYRVNSTIYTSTYLSSTGNLYYDVPHET